MSSNVSEPAQPWWDSLNWQEKERLLVCRSWGNMSLEEQQKVRELYGVLH